MITGALWELEATPATTASVFTASLMFVWFFLTHAILNCFIAALMSIDLPLYR